MAQLAVDGPLDEGDLHHDLGTHPVRAQARQPGRFRERRLRDLDAIEPRAQIEQQLRVEARADFAGEHEIVWLALRLALRAPRALSRGEIPDEQRTEPDARALRIGEAAD